MKQYICIDIGGTAIKYGVVQSGEIPEIIRTDSCKTPENGTKILQKVFDIIEGLKRNCGQTEAVCISSAGIVNSEEGCILEANDDLIPGYTGTKIADRVKEKFGTPCFVENDVNCAAMAEYYAGAAKGYHSMLMLTIGTGIGGAFIAGGKLLKGHTYSACEVGYMNMEEGTFEEIAATSALVARTAKRLHKTADAISGKWIFEQAQDGNEVCIEEIDRMCDILAKGISNICYVLNPEIVLLGGGISAQTDWLKPRIEMGMEKYLIPVIRKKTKLDFAKFKNQAGMIGAYYAAGFIG
jgi:hypothetical protein